MASPLFGRRRPAAVAEKTTEDSGMNWDRIEGNWKQFTGKVQQQWGKLTDDDLQLVEGRRNELVGRIQERYGYARDRAEREVDDWLRGI
jgi:uncharacterized protein YjbJ (UPF0337 family)